MAGSAHAYVRGNTRKFYEWLDTTDNRYVTMFTRTADTLERHARMRAFGEVGDEEDSSELKAGHG